jgi:hypothetical protein
MSLALPMNEASAVSPGSERIASAVERAAVRFVRIWGFTTVETVAGHFRMLTPAPAPRASLARLALARLPDIVWLDPTREWFSLLDRAEGMRAALEKIRAAVGLVDVDELERALGKRHSFGEAPRAVVRAFVEALSALPSCRELVTRLTPEELTLLEAFESAGGAAHLDELRAATRGRLPPVALARVLQASPLFLHTGRGAYRLVGRSLPWTPSPHLVPSAAWQAL